MTEPVIYTESSDQTNQNNNPLWMIVLGFVALLVILFVIFSNGNNSSNEVLPTQVPQNPQSTQVLQEPQSTQVPQSTTMPTPTTQL